MTTLSITLSVLLIIALLILLVPLIKNNEANSDKTVKKSLIGVAVFVPTFTMAGYFWLGTPEFAEIATQQAPPKQVTLVDKLEEKLKQNPKDLNGWMLLGRSYMVTDEYPKAIKAFEKAYLLDTHNLNAILSLADALAINKQGNLIGRPYQLLIQAYELDDKNQMALWLLGLAEKQLDNPESAAKYWLELYKQLPAGSDDRIKIKALLASVGKDRVDTGVENENDNSTPEQQTISNQVRFKIDNRIREENPNATVFIYAKEQQGMPMPVAAQKHLISELPDSIKLGASDEIMPQRKINQFDELVVGIKINNGTASDSTVIFKKEQLLNHNKSANIIINF